MKHIVCLGYAKCGTTMLDTVFRKSRLVATPRERKEIKFFLHPQFPERDQYAAYLGQFFGEAGPTQLVTHTFEASPPYCHQSPEEFRQVLERIRNTLPDYRAVICMRHPIARAYSHYIHNLHAFGLYGHGVYGGRPTLPQRVYRDTFEQALLGSPRIMTHYYDYLKLGFDVLGADNVNLFFLESDTADFRHWMSTVVGGEVVADLELSDSPPKAVIPRRPVPNYAVRDEVLIAFGSREGELVRYEGLSHPQRRAVLDSRKSWTLELSEAEVSRLVGIHFAEDLERCAALTGDKRFLGYLTSQPDHQAATLTNGKLLADIHGVR